MRQRCLAAFAVLLAVLTASCGASRPISYYALEPPTLPAAAKSFPISLVVGRISAPLLYRDDRIVYDSGPVQRGALEYHRWAEPPSDMVQNMLLTALRASGQYRSVGRQTSNARGDYILRGRLDAIEEVDSPTISARFSLALELFDPKTGATVWFQSYSHDEPVKEKQVTAVIEAMNRNVQQGIVQLVTGLGQYFAEHPPQ